MNAEAIQIRRGRPADAATIVSFNRLLAEETETLELDRATLEEGVAAALSDGSKGMYFVAEVDRQVVGQLMVTREWSDWRNGDIWWIQSVYVAAEFRRRGVFRALYEHAVERARAAGAPAVRLYVEKHNASALQTYGRLGMELTSYLVMEQSLRG